MNLVWKLFSCCKAPNARSAQFIQFYGSLIQVAALHIRDTGTHTETCKIFYLIVFSNFVLSLIIFILDLVYMFIEHIGSFQLTISKACNNRNNHHILYLEFLMLIEYIYIFFSISYSNTGFEAEGRTETYLLFLCFFLFSL